MGLFNTLHRVIRRASGSHKTSGQLGGRRPPTRQLQIEPLEDRCVPASVTIGPGDSIQAAVDTAAPGTTIYLRPGTYYQSVVVNTPDMALVGLGRHKPVIIDPAGAGDGADNGIRVNDAGDRFQARNLVLKDFDRNGIFAMRTDDFVFSGVDTIACGAYGLFPVRSEGGLIRDCTASGHTDAGIYVGSSTDITVRDCRAWANVVGIEVSNASNIEVRNNLVYDNTAGIGVLLLPGRSVTTAADIRLHGNVVIGNNRPNFGEPGDLVSFVPSGLGIFVVGVDRVTIDRNVVIGNDLVGVGLASSLLFGPLTGLPPEAFDSIEPNCDGARVRNNLVVFNGLQASNPLVPSGDLVWDGTGTDNHWRSNIFLSSAPRQLPF
jgi:parallel beta-helix repeat protein